MREALKYFHWNTVLLSENDDFPIRSLFVKHELKRSVEV